MISAVPFALVTALCLLIVWLAWGGHTRAHHLSSRGWMLYLLPGCGACHMQLELLRPAGAYKPAYVCGVRGDAADRAAGCPSEFPYWRNTRTGEVRVGVQDAGALRDMAAA